MNVSGQTYSLQIMHSKVALLVFPLPLQLTEWMVRIAPVLIFSTLLVKTRRLYQIFYNTKQKQDIVSNHNRVHEGG